MKLQKQRYELVRISVEIRDVGRGLTDERCAKLCRRIEKMCKGKSKTREVSAIV